MQEEAQRSAAGEGGSTATTTPGATHDETPTYGAYYYDRLIGDYEVSGRYEYEGVWKEFFRVMAHHIVTRFQPHKTLDAGCAKGFLIRALREHHVDAFGVDSSEYAISQADDSIKDYVRVGSITEDLGGPYDLISCIEVIEHIPDSDIELAIERLCAATDRVLFSSTPNDFVEPSHISVKLPEDWVALFAKQGFYRNFTIDASFLTPWAVLFEPAVMTVPSVVARYEREYAEASREGLHLRHRLMDSDRVRAELEQEVRELRSSLVDEAAAKLSAARDEAVAAKLRALQLRQKVTELEAELDARERTLWELLDEVERYRRGGG